LAEGKELYAIYNIVGADYFHTLGLPLLRGREFERREAEATPAAPVAIISQNLADQLWPGEEPLGRLIQFPSPGRGASPTVMTVVGVVPAIHWKLFDQHLPEEVYVPLGQDFQANLKIHIRVAPGLDPAKLMTAAREELRRLDPQLPLTEVKTLMALHRDGPYVRVAHLGSVLFGAFGGLAVLLTALGIYGLKAYAVARRTREIGIRMALGANARDVVGLILRESVWLAGLGLSLGLLLALAVGKLAGSFLYQVHSMDPLTFSVVPPLLLGVALLACWLPARRAARVDPMMALRAE
jgi:predicted permease